MSDLDCSMPEPEPGRHAIALLNRPWRVLHFAIAVSVAFLSCGAAGLAGLIAGDPRNMPDYLVPVVTPLLFHVPALAAVLAMSRRLGITIEHGFGVTRRNALRSAAYGLKLCVVVFPPVWLAALVSQLVYSMSGTSPEIQPVIRMMAESSGQSPWLGTLAVVQSTLVVPLIEETVFRGIALPAFSKRIGILPAAALVSAIFAIVHQHPPAYMPLFILSLALCFAYIRSESIIAPVVIHSLFNMISVAVVLLSGL